MDGYSSFNQDQKDQISITQPDLTLVAYGCPKQDEIIYQLSQVLPFGVAVGVGGAFDIWSGIKKRAPEWVQRMGLEWLYRLIKEPQRVGRLIRAIIYFCTPTGFVND